MKTVLFHGQAGSGKDTQVEKLLEKYSVERIATGEMFRKMADEGDEFAKDLNESKLAKGLWPTPDETYKLFEGWVKRFDSKKDWILVSVVRYFEQIPYLDRVLEKEGRKLDLVIHFTLSEEEALRRLSGRKICPNCQGTFHPIFKKEKVEGVCDICGSKLMVRNDDKPESIKQRFENYQKTIQPWIDEYKKRGILVEIDASPSIEEIHKEVVKALGYE